MNPVACSTSGGGVLDNLVIEFGKAASLWQSQINPLAQHLFFILFGMEFMWQLVINKVFMGDVEKIWLMFFARVVLGFFFAKYIINVHLYQQIIEYFAMLGGRISGFALNINSNNTFNVLGPSEIISNFSCIADVIHQVTDNVGSLDYITLKFSLAIMQVLLFVVLAYLSFYLIKVILQAYFLLYAGFILTGFAGSSWTRSFWQRYVEAIAGIAIKFLAVSFLLGILTAQIKHWATDINQATDIVQLSGVVLRVLGSAIIITLLSHQLPEWASSVLAGNINMQFASQLINVARSVSSSMRSYITPNQKD
jgi:P-type conjugative transfer protein TrbL